MTRPDKGMAPSRSGLTVLAATFLAGVALAMVTLFANEGKESKQVSKQTAATLPGSRIPVSIGDRIKYVQGLSDVQKQELEEKKKKFDALSPNRKKQLRELAKQLGEHKDSAKLSSTLTTYRDFLLSLDENEMNRFRTAADDKKIEVIREIELARNEWLSNFPKQSDAAAIYQWLLERSTKCREKLVKQLSEAPQGKPGGQGSPQGPGYLQQVLRNAIASDIPEQAEFARVVAYQHALWFARDRREEGGKLVPKDEDIEQLLSRLSPLMVSTYRNKEPEKRGELLGRWFWFSTYTQGRSLPSTDEAYAEFAKLPEAEQKALSQMPIEQKKWHLVKRAFEQRLGMQAPPPNPAAPGPRAPGGWNGGYGGPRIENWGPHKKREEGRPPEGNGPSPRDGRPRAGGPPGPPPNEDRRARPQSEKIKSESSESPTPSSATPESEEPNSDGKETPEPDKASRQFARKLRVKLAN